MKLERGFRRIVLIWSLGVLVAASGLLWVLAPEIERTWPPAVQGVEHVRDEGEDRVYNVTTTRGVFEVVVVPVRGGGLAALKAELARRKDPTASVSAAFADYWRTAAPQPRVSWQVWTGGALVSVGLALVPWGIFYGIRWIVRGFSGG